MAENPCPLYADGHHMKASILPKVVDENGATVSTFAVGGFYTCTGCGEQFIASGAPQLGWYIADYVTQGGILGIIAVGGATVAQIKRSAIRYIQSATLPGYKFL